MDSIFDFWQYSIWYGQLKDLELFRFLKALRVHWTSFGCFVLSNVLKYSIKDFNFVYENWIDFLNCFGFGRKCLIFKVYLFIINVIMFISYEKWRIISVDFCTFQWDMNLHIFNSLFLLGLYKHSI